MIEALIKEMNTFHLVALLAVLFAFFGAFVLIIYYTVLAALNKHFGERCDCEGDKQDIESEKEFVMNWKKAAELYRKSLRLETPDATADVTEKREEVMEHPYKWTKERRREFMGKCESALKQKKDFLKLPIEERRKILAEQVKEFNILLPNHYCDAPFEKTDGVKQERNNAE